jgi:single-stranded DNA-specific DHH superfamily exonuclease
MAQDFFAAFKVGESDRLINSLDIDGVNLAGVRALDTRTAKQQAQIEKLEKSNAELKKQNEELLKRLEKLEAKLK